MSPHPFTPVHRTALALAITAAALPSLLAYNVSPSPTFLNQALALGLWGAWVWVCAPGLSVRGAAPLYAALALVAMGAAWSWGPGALPASLALSAIGSLAAAAVLAAGGAGVRLRDARHDLFAAFCWAWLVAGLLNVGVAGVQVFLPEWPDGNWIAHSGYPGRAVGNLRQPNHLSSLLLWSCIAVVALLELGRLGRRAAALALAALVFAVVLTASRTGLVSVLLLALWGLFDRRLSRPARGLLLAAPVIYALSWLAMAQWAALSQHAFGGSQRLAEGDISSSRFAIWRDTWALIRMHPWAGVGFGDFNLAWTLTPFPHRAVAFFDHTHNLPLQLAVELGLPLASLVMALLLWALWRAARQAWATEGSEGTALRSALMMVLMIGLHSLLEYPLWYSYFLLPAAWAFGFALHAPAVLGGKPGEPGASPRAAPGLRLAALAVVVGAALAVADYTRVAAIFSSTSDAPLEQRIAAGQRSLFFAHHADYAEVTSGVPVRDPAHAFDRAAHYLLDTRLMMAWARSLAERGELDAARHLAERLREFRNADAKEFFEPCPQAASAAGAASAASAAILGQPFQCERPVKAPGWQAYLPQPR
ncbi:PglL family O-oligosaccharyltransferase [Brevundimonas sp.]|uniref:PglL family O-oligosaccharyltransferase n=1 Tax=Brevundimonas sp. TaxID=1871086 RepID=UPI002730AEB0|nr:O-antigen ligase family protein [Brevundimonas sp.]MDP1912185.1 Wzy polymerase domain-containing protein [Brevundimonas sp.]